MTSRGLVQCGESPNFARGEVFRGERRDDAPRVRSRKIKFRERLLCLNRVHVPRFEGLRLPVLVARPAQCFRDTATSMRSNSRSAGMTVKCQNGKVKLRLRLDHQVQFGEHIALLGSAESAGSWQQKVNMGWTESGWVAELEANAGEEIEYKYLIVTGDGNLIWEGGPNRVLAIPSPGNYEVVSRWDTTHEEVKFEGRHSESDEAGETEKNIGKENGSLVLEDELDTSSSFVQGWQGKEITFMRSNDHSHEKSGKWDTTGLEGPALHIVEGDRDARNWWRKLEVVRSLVTGDLGKTQRMDALILTAIYLKWINTGQIACYEDGGHYRPSKHAEIARHIFKELERISTERGTSSQELTIIRKIHPCLPAFKAEFTASVPLTRIRDIAHRNDIPHDLKQEIKHTIQNKLHRNAGPEDLVATEAMLTRVTKNHGEYSSAFVEQLKIFYSELKDFFNASSLTEQLEAIVDSFDEPQKSVLANFLKSKKALDDLGSLTNGSLSKGSESIIGAMHNLTSLRAVLVKGLESGLRNDASDEAIAMRQKWRLCEIGLEDYSFVLLSRFINGLEAGGGSSWLTNEALAGNVAKWNQPLGAVVLGIRQIGLSGWQEKECLALENELLAWQTAGIIQKNGLEEDRRLWALRLKATLDRTRRVAESYTDVLLQLYPKMVEKLGRAFGIPENTVRTFTEAEIRASVVFQLSKLCSLLLKAVRAVSGGEGWDVIMPGKAIGTLIEVEHIIPGSLPSSKGSIILLVKTASGDEEVKAAGPNVAGVVLQHELPHLSHLGVRARQEKVVFTTLDDEEKIVDLRSLLGKTVKLEASSEVVSLKVYDGLPENEKELANIGSQSRLQETSVGSDSPGSHTGVVALSKSKSSPVLSSKVVKGRAGEILELSKATTEKGGSKSAACGELSVLSATSGRVISDQGISASFLVPKGLVIPFGAMEEAIESSGNRQKFQVLLDQTETAQVQGGELDNVCNEIRTLISELRPHKAIISKIGSDFPSSAKLIVRSSANVEDLAGMSGAGLYDSIPNVNPSDPENFGKAVAEVWGSLYTRRAVLSRRVAGVPQQEAAMAILVQELLAPELSFVLHTVSPIDHDKSVLQAEIAAGLGETLASGTRGTPWRLSTNKLTGKVKTLAFANFSEELVVSSGGAADGKMVAQVVDYSKKKLSTDPVYRTQVGERLGIIGFFLESKFGSAQDVEGCIVGNDIFIVQTRPQP